MHDDQSTPLTQPAIVRRGGLNTVEDVRRRYDSIAVADPSHGIAQSIAIGQAAEREHERVERLIADARKDGATTDAQIAHRLITMGVAVGP